MTSQSESGWARCVIIAFDVPRFQKNAVFRAFQDWAEVPCRVEVMTFERQIGLSSPVEIDDAVRVHSPMERAYFSRKTVLGSRHGRLEYVRETYVGLFNTKTCEITEDVPKFTSADGEQELDHMEANRREYRPTLRGWRGRAVTVPQPSREGGPKGSSESWYMRE